MNLLAENTELNSLLLKAPGNFFIWDRFLAQLTLQLNCDSSALLVTDLTQPENTHFLFNANIPQEYQEQYENELNTLDAFNHFISKNPQQVFCNQNLKDSHGNKTNGKFIQAEGQNYRFGVSMPCNHSHSFNLLVNRKKMFNDVELHQVTRYLKSIIPFLETAIYEEQRHKINSQLFNYTGVHFAGYIIIDRGLNILFSNPDYPSFIGQMDCVNVSGNRLCVKNPALEQQLLSLIENDDKAASIRNQCHSCQITLIPMSSLENLYQWECYKGGFILVFTHENKKNTIIGRLEDIFQLSRCEAICAHNFMNTPSIQDIAANTYRSEETIRNHIKRTMQKMDVHNQAELMKKLITLAAL
jgi:DNA-binding CsgD family transcriptional regulator